MSSAGDAGVAKAEVADEKTQKRIVDVGRRLGMRMAANGYRCAGGGHSLSFEQFPVSTVDSKAPTAKPDQMRRLGNALRT